MTEDKRLHKAKLTLRLAGYIARSDPMSKRKQQPMAWLQPMRCEAIAAGILDSLTLKDLDEIRELFP